MSATTPTPAATLSNPTPGVRDTIIAEARSLPQLIALAHSNDPTLADALTEKSLIASKTPWGVLAAAIVGWLVAHYALGFDQATTDLIAGACVVAGSYGMRVITRSPIGSVLPVTTP